MQLICMLTLHIYATDTTQIDENSQLTESESFLKKIPKFYVAQICPITTQYPIVSIKFNR